MPKKQKLERPLVDKATGYIDIRVVNIVPLFTTYNYVLLLKCGIVIFFIN